MENNSGVKLSPEDARKAALLEHGKDTRFGAENGNPRADQIKGSNKPWSVHNSVRYFSAQEIDENDESDHDVETRKRPMKRILGRNPTRAERIALKAVQLAESGDIRAIEFVTERVDGKVANMNMNGDLAQIQNMTDEQINEQLDRFYAARKPADADAATGAGDATDPAESGDGTATA